MKFYLTEKPKTARQLCDVLGKSRHIKSSNSTTFGGHKQGDGWMVGWLSGHFFRLFHPHEYNEKYKRWNLQDLPIIYSDIDWKPLDESDYPTPDDIREQINHLKSLYPLITEFILATDGDQEGQVLGQVFIEQTGWKGPVKRFWTGVWEPTGLRRNLEKLTDNAEYQRIYNAGVSRMLLDKVIGINLTRLYTLKAHQAGYNITANTGRVRSPATAIAVDHEAHVKAHNSRQYYSLRANLSHKGQPFRAKLSIPENLLTDSKHCFDETRIALIKRTIEGEKSAIVKNVVSNTTQQKAPLPYSQNTLSQYCSQQLGLLPHETLAEAQIIYEAGYISYPRTESDFYEPDVLINAALTFEMLSGLTNEFKSAVAQTSLDNPQPVFSYEKIDGHGAIFVTPLKPDLNALSNNQRFIYTAIANRLLAQFMRPLETAHNKLILTIGSYTFTAESQSVVNPGWSIVEAKADSADEKILPAIEIGATCEIDEIILHQRMTKAPPRLTVDAFQEILKDCTHLLSPNIAQKVGKGMLGTGATQPYILKTITDQGVVQIVDKKYVVPTKRGRDLRNLLPDLIASPDLTSLWELNFRSIHSGQLSHHDFIEKALNWLSAIVIKGKESKFPPSPTITPCEMCSSALLRRQQKSDETSYYWVCSNTECDVFVPDVAGLPLSLHKDHGKPCDTCNSKLITRYDKRSKTSYVRCKVCKNSEVIGTKDK